MSLCWRRWWAFVFSIGSEWSLWLNFSRCSLGCVGCRCLSFLFGSDSWGTEWTCPSGLSISRSGHSCLLLLWLWWFFWNFGFVLFFWALSQHLDLWDHKLRYRYGWLYPHVSWNLPQLDFPHRKFLGIWWPPDRTKWSDRPRVKSLRMRWSRWGWAQTPM